MSTLWNGQSQPRHRRQRLVELQLLLPYADDLRIQSRPCLATVRSVGDAVLRRHRTAGRGGFLPFEVRPRLGNRGGRLPRGNSGRSRRPSRVDLDPTRRHASLQIQRRRRPRRVVQHRLRFRPVADHRSRPENVSAIAASRATWSTAQPPAAQSPARSTSPPSSIRPWPRSPVGRMERTLDRSKN